MSEYMLKNLKTGRILPGVYNSREQAEAAKQLRSLGLTVHNASRRLQVVPKEKEDT